MSLFEVLLDVQERKEERKDKAEKKRKAKEYIQQAKRYVQDGENIYEKAYDRVSEYAYETESRVEKHIQFKKDIAKEISGDIANTIDKFTNFNIDGKIISKPDVGGIKMSGSLSLSLDKITSSVNFTSSIISPLVFSFFDTFSEDDYWEAMSQCEEAKRYKEKMKREKEKLYKQKERMEQIRDFIRVEEFEIESLMRKVRHMKDELNRGMDRRQFTHEEAKYLKGIHGISKKIVSLFSERFLADDFCITEKYKQLFGEIKSINENLPALPSVKDTITLRIFDNMIVY